MDDYSRHEAMHMASVLADIVGDKLCDHRYVRKDKKAKELADKAFQALFDLYQYIGKEHLK